MELRRAMASHETLDLAVLPTVRSRGYLGSPSPTPPFGFPLFQDYVTVANPQGALVSVIWAGVEPHQEVLLEALVIT